MLVKDFTLCSVYHSNQPLRKIHGISLIHFNFVTIDKSNQVKVSGKIKQCLGYFLKLLWGQVGGHTLCGSKDITNLVFLLDLAIPRNQRTLWIYRRKILIVFPHPAKFGSHMHCGSADKMFLVCHVIPQYLVIKWSCEFIGRGRSR